MRLMQNFKNKVLKGGVIHQKLCSTATGTGFASGNKVGMFCLDRSAGDWFVCTVSAGSGTWVKVNA